VTLLSLIVLIPAMDLRIHQVVNAPLITVGATLPKSLLPLVKKLVIGEM